VFLLGWFLQARGEISIKRLDTLVQEDVQVRCAVLCCVCWLMRDALAGQLCCAFIMCWHGL
jgi:hypothetical protein